MLRNWCMLCVEFAVSSSFGNMNFVKFATMMN